MHFHGENGNRILFQRQNALVAMNQTWLCQLLSLLENLNDTCFHSAPAAMPLQRVRGHVRHIVEFYECFLDGLADGHIDYDARRRDPRIEASPRAAADRVRALTRRLSENDELLGDAVIFVRVEDASALGLRDPFVSSSIGRELMMLSSHTVQHFAMVAAIVAQHGWPVDEDFGVAPSTVRHRATRPQLLRKESA